MDLDAPSPTRDRLDKTTWNQLRSQDFRLLDVLAYLSKLHSQRSPTGAHYCTPGRTWLARQLQCSTRTISRHTARLAALGVIQKTQRRPRAGHWSTNLYRVVRRAGWRAAAFAQTLRTVTHRLTQPARLASPSGRENVSPRPNESLRDIIRRGMAKFAAP